MPMNLFSRLLRLHKQRANIVSGNEPVRSRTPQEDFFTEVFAFIAEKHAEIILDWLSPELIAHPSAKTRLQVETQVTFCAPADSETDPDPDYKERSRIDAVLKINNGESTDLVFLESKVDSNENEDQLPKYVATLKQQKVSGKRWLLFVTRDFEPKEQGSLKLEGKVKFLQWRWSQFYEILQKYTHHPIINEVIKFMEEIRMFRVKTFRDQDVTTIQNLKSAISAMEATLDESVEQQFAKITGAQGRTLSRLDDVASLGRYVHKCVMPEGMGCALGYFPSTGPGESPLVGIRISIPPDCAEASRTIIKNCMKEFSTRNGWNADNLDESSGDHWIRIERVQDLKTFMKPNDHVGNVRQFFGELLDELKQFRELVNSRMS